MARHRRRLNGPLLDRIDLLVSMQRATPEELRGPPCTASARAREQVLAARERQAARYRHEAVLVNAHMDGRMLRFYGRLDDDGERLLVDAQRDGALSARGVHRVLRVARTLADLSGAARVTRSHVGQAISLRADAALVNRRAA